MSSRAASPRVLGVAWAILWRGLAFSVAWGVLAAPLVMFLPGWLARSFEASLMVGQLAIDGIVCAALLLATWLFARVVDREPTSCAGLSLSRLPQQFGIGFAIGLAWLALTIGVLVCAGWLKLAPHGQFHWNALPLAASAVLVNVFAQQLILTGYLFSMFRSRAGLPVAVTISGILFAAYHAPAFQGEWLPAANVLLAGILFCLAREISGAVWLPLGVHMAWNLMLGPVLGGTVSGHGSLGGDWTPFESNGPSWVTGGEFGTEGGVVTTVATLCVIAALLRSLAAGRNHAGASPSGQT